MTVLTKTKRRHKHPRCEQITNQGRRCTFAGIQYIGGRCVCRKHSQGGAGNGSNQDD